VTWPGLFVAFIASHVTGDLLLQTESQAVTKVQGLRTADGRRALSRHAFTYTLAFVPALIWVGNNRSVLGAIGIGFLIVVPHVILDDGRFVRFWMREVKHASDPAPSLSVMVDQSFHVVCLLAAALIAVS
jgi:hypothetical protein